MNRRSLVVIAALFAASSASAAGFEKVRTASGRQMDALPGQVIVRYRASGASDGRARIASLGGRVRGQIARLNVQLVSIPAGHTIESFIEVLRRDPNVEFAEPNGVMKALAFPQDPPNDALFPQQYPLAYNGAGANLSAASINIRPAWIITRGTPDVVVAVVDTGIDFNNADLHNIVQGRRFEIDWFNDGDCTDNPTNSPELGVCNGCAGVGPDMCEGPDTEDDNNIDEFSGNPVVAEATYHGTRVAGIIAARTDNGLTMAGVAPEVSIMPIKVLNSWGFGSFFSIADGIVWAADNGADVINLSLGGNSVDPSGVVQAALTHALDLNCVIVAAGGNSGRFTPVNFPASFPGVIAVGSINSANQLSDFSATGKTLDLVAPGEDIFGTVPSTVAVAGANQNDGTSFSAPIVAGVAALIRSIKPGMSWQQVTQYIDFTATDLGSAGFDTNFGFGRLNAGAAVAAADAGTVFVSNPAEPGETFPYPNPFRPGPGRTVTIALPASLGDDGIKIDIMNLAGEKVRTLSGTNSWDGRSDDGDLVASGLYFYFAKTSTGNAKGKLTLIK